MRAAEWREFDLDGAAWRIPAAKIKMRTEHMVPLSTQALEILRQLRRITGVYQTYRSDNHSDTGGYMAGDLDQPAKPGRAIAPGQKNGAGFTLRHCA